MIVSEEDERVASGDGTIACDTGEIFQLLSHTMPAQIESHEDPEQCRCDWQALGGDTYLPGYPNDSPLAALSLQAARLHCEAMGAACAGVTRQPCVSGFSYQTQIYSLRADSAPVASPQEETSWIKICDIVDSDEALSEPSTNPLAMLEENAGTLPSVGACDEEHFIRLRDAATEYYKQDVVSVHLLLYFGDVLREAASIGWRQLAARCVLATLLVLLLRMEERVLVNPEEYDSLSTLYSDKLHEGLAAGSVPAAEWARWPLAQGWRRVNKLQHLAAPGRRSGASVDFVLCYCGVSRSPGAGYPAVEDSLGWLVQLLAQARALERQGQIRVFIKEKCGEAADPRLPQALKQAFAGLASIVDVEHVEDELRADDATAYLAHLAGDRHSELADWTFFLHADAPEHVHPFRLLEEVFAAAHSGALSIDTFPFLYLSHNYLDLGTSRHTWEAYASPLLWRRIFGSSIAPPRSAVKGYCCVQFLVPRPRLLLRSRAWYSQTMRWFASAESYWNLFPAGKLVTWQDLTCRAPAQLWMAWWHVVFGEELAYPERHLDQRLPLFLQLRSIPPDRIHCC